MEALVVHNPLTHYLFHTVRRRTLVVPLIPIQGSSSLLHGKDTPRSCHFPREFYLLCMPPGNFCEFYTIWLDSNATCVRISSIQHTHVRTKQTSNALRATVNRSRTDAQDLQFSPFQSQPMHKLPIHMRQLCGLFVFMRFAGAARAFLCYPKLCVRSLADFLSPPYPLQNSSSAILVVSAPLGRSLPPVGRPVKSM